MFTGIVSAIGSVAGIDLGPGGGSARISVSEPGTAGRLAVGASVAVNGCCLTVIRLAPPAFDLEAVPETLARTNLGALRPGSGVNLELPVTLGGRLDGHLLQGHVDAAAQIIGVAPVELGRELTVELPAALARYVAEKGSIGIDGVSLTVAGLEGAGRAFRVALIPHTLEVTIAGGYEAGTVVNLEVDVIARYTERLLAIPERVI